LLIPTAALGHLQMGNVNVTLSANLLLGSLPGVFIGSKLCARLPEISGVRWLEERDRDDGYLFSRASSSPRGRVFMTSDDAAHPRRAVRTP
jgi:hypothetical protein